MPKNPSQTWVPKGGTRMRHGKLPNGQSQDFYFPDDHPQCPGWFKGMENIIRERRLWPDGGLRAQCEGFKCEPGRTDCCCCRLLFTQPDFVDQKSRLEELIESCGHICDFYPKFHLELNCIEQYWGASKYLYRLSPVTSDMQQMRENVRACLDAIPRSRIVR